MTNRTRIAIYAGVLFAVCATGIAADSAVDIYSAKDLQSMGQSLAKPGKTFASRELTRYGNHYTMLAMRESTGSAEVHEHEADIFVIESGQATYRDRRKDC